jgi:hypothetical protein
VTRSDLLSDTQSECALHSADLTGSDLNGFVCLVASADILLVADFQMASAQIAPAASSPNPASAAAPNHFFKYRDATVAFCLLMGANAPADAKSKFNALFAPGAKINFPTDPVGMPVQAVFELAHGLFQSSFPDFTFSPFVNSYVENAENHTSTIMIQPQGRFTGTPFVFPPGQGLPEIPATGKIIQASVAPIRLHFTQSGLITLIEILPFPNDQVPGQYTYWDEINTYLEPQVQRAWNRIRR